MLGYISSTRKKSCYACVKSKRRCDLGYPFCARCYTKGLECEYPNAVPQKEQNIPAEVVIRQSTPDFIPPLVSAFSSAPNEAAFNNTAALGEAPIDPLCFETYISSGSGSSTSPESWSDGQEEWKEQAQEPEPVRTQEIPWPAPQMVAELVPDLVLPTYQTEDQVIFCIRNEVQFVHTMAYNGSTIFCHKNLYRKYEPPAFQDCVALSALYLTRSPRSHRILANSIASKIENLIATSSTWSLTEHLAAVQALIIYQVIRLFDRDLNLQGSAEKHNTLLEVWSAHLWKRFFSEPQHHKTRYEAFVFNESLRRTIMMSVFIRCSWSCVTAGGLADKVAVLARLPLASNIEAWRCEVDEELGPVPMLEKEDLMTYSDLAMRWRGEESIEGLDPYLRLLLGACRGREDPRLLM